MDIFDYSLFIVLLRCLYNLVILAYCGEVEKLEEKRRKRKQRRWWVRPLLGERKTEGAFVKLLRKGPQHGFYIHRYLRLAACEFEYLVMRVGPILARQST